MARMAFYKKRNLNKQAEIIATNLYPICQL